MYKQVKHNWSKHLDFFIFDLLGMQLAYVLAFMLRHGFENPYELPVYRVIGAFYVLIGLCSLIFMEEYENILKRGYLIELEKVILFVTGINLVASSVVFMDKSLREFSRAVFIETWLISILIIFCMRIWLKKLIKAQTKHKRIKRKVVVITSSSMVEDIINKMKANDYLEFLIAGVILLDRNQKGKVIAGIPVVASKEDAIQYLKNSIVDEIFLNLPREMELPETIMKACRDMGITVHLNLMRLSEGYENKVVEKFAGYTVITSSMKVASSREIFLKRALDICGGLVGVLITGILTIFVAPIILIQSPGPIFFAQERVGKNGRRFKIYKFRSMYLDAEARKVELLAMNEMQGLMFKMKDDPRIFPFGNFIRKYSIDEFPQFFNILKGDMSLVGTRPPTVDEYEHYELRHMKRLSTKPGLTGMWQVSGRSDITDFEEVVKLDAKYITEWSFGLDLKILVKTMGVVFRKKGAV